MTNLVLSQDSGAVRTLTINRPEQLNALNLDLLKSLHREFDRAFEDGIRAIILTGSGKKAFVAGADIAQMTNFSPIQAQDFSRLGQDLMLKIEHAPIPVIAAINGFALGGGCELALACHLRYASESALLGQPELNLGLIPGFGGTQRITRISGRSAALELCLTAKPISAERAYQLGLVNQVIANDQLTASCTKLANKLASQSRQQIKQLLQLIIEGESMPLSNALSMETLAFGQSFATADMREGTQAFLEKRKADFSS